METEKVQVDTSKLLRLPSGSVPVEDPEEEVFLLYTHLASAGAQDGSTTFIGLGSVNTHQDTLSVQLTLSPNKNREESSAELTHACDTQSTKKHHHHHHAKKVAKKHVEVREQIIEIELHQDKTSLRSRKGDTGSVLWRVSVALAQALLSDLSKNSLSSLLDPQILKNCDVLELGGGTGLLSIILAPWVHRYTVTDLDYLVPLIRRNITTNLPVVQKAISPASSSTLTSPTNRRSSRHGDSSSHSVVNNIKKPSDPEQFVSVEALDWVALQRASSISPSKASSLFRLTHADPPDLIISVDCVYNTALIPALLGTIDHYASPGRTRVLVAVELRAEDVMREFLECWLAMKDWVVWRVGERLEDDERGDTNVKKDDDGASWLGVGFAVWVGWKVCKEKESER